jgi:drug/metabolite transporter (DMT)-like permease
LSGEANTWYVISLLVATVGWSFGTLVQKRVVQPGTVLSFTCAQMFFGGLFQLGMSVVDREWGAFDPSGVTWSSLLAVAYLIVFGSIIAFTAYLWLLSRMPASQVTTYALVNPVVALLIGAVVLHEPVTAFVGLAAIMVLMGVALVLFQSWTPRLIWWRRAPAAE